MKTRFKVALVGAGYVAAFAIASLALAVRLATLRGPDFAGGMADFGDLALFAGVFGFCSIIPTGLALFYLRARPLAWTIASSLALSVALSGVAAITVYVFGRNAGPRSALADWAGLAPLRMLPAPLLAFSFFAFTFIAPRRGARIALAIAMLCEAAVATAMGYLWFNPFQH